MSLNKVMLIGNVGRDPEVRYLEAMGPNGQGRKVATFTLATSERYRDRNGELKENTEWHNIVAWGQSADVAEKYVRKGTQLFIEGRLRTRSWADQNGVKKYTTEINVDVLQLLGKREGSSSEGGYAPSAPAPQPSYSAPVAPAAQPSYSAPSPQTAAVSPQSAPSPEPGPAPFSPADEVDDLPF